jgi:hypothetical protein
MHECAALTALAITLNIAMLTPAVSAGAGPPHWMPRHEVRLRQLGKGSPWICYPVSL